MRAASMGFVLLPLLGGQIALAQTTQPQTRRQPRRQTAPAVEDFKPASSNQGGKEYPQVNSERRAASGSSRLRPRVYGCPSGAESL